MNYKRTLYIVEGKCEKQLIEALKEEPGIISPGEVKEINVVHQIIPRRIINMIRAGTRVVFVFDTDVEQTQILRENINHVKKYAALVKVITIPQVLNFEDEIVRSTDVRKAKELTKSSGVSGFKNDFCKLKVSECRNTLNRHHFDVNLLWNQNAPTAFSFVNQGSKYIKI